MILGSDHGSTISVDRGKTWTSWYNQPTGQIYHVVTDDAFPYVVYGMQQDNGTAGVYSRTDHESINARDWFIAAQSESGYVALDPLHKDILFASGPNGSVVRFNKKTSHAQDITPWPGTGMSEDLSKRKYRDTWTPVLVMSPADRKSLYFGTQYMMKTVGRRSALGADQPRPHRWQAAQRGGDEANRLGREQWRGSRRPTRTRGRVRSSHQPELDGTRLRNYLHHRGLAV